MKFIQCVICNLKGCRKVYMLEITCLYDREDLHCGSDWKWLVE